MAVEEMAEQSSGRRRRSRAGSNLNVSFNGGGVVLLLGAAAGALLASVFAANRIRAHKRRRGSTTEGIQGDSGERLASNEGKEFVGDEGGEGGGDNEGEEVVQVNLHDNLDASVHISQAVQIEIDFYLLEEGQEEVAERNPTTDIEVVDGEHGKLAACRCSSADVNHSNSSPAKACPNLGIGSGLGENKTRYDDEELVAACVKEQCKTSFINCKENDEEDIKNTYIDEWGEREEIEEKFISSGQYSEQPRLIKGNSCNHLHPVEALEFVEDEEEVKGVANTREERIQANIIDDLHGGLEILDFVKRESNIYLDKKVEKTSSTKEIELVDGIEGEQACIRGSRAKIGSSPANAYNNLGIGSNLGEYQLRYGDEQLASNNVREEGETLFINSKEDEGDSKKAYIEEWGEEELEEKNTLQNLNIEICLLKESQVSHPSQIGSSPANVYNNLGIGCCLGEDQLRYGDEQLVSNSVREEGETPFVNSKEDEGGSKKAYIEEWGANVELDEKNTRQNLIIEELCLPNNDSDKDAEMVISEDENRMDSDGFKYAVTSDILCVEQDKDEGDVSNEKMVEGSRGLCKQTLLPYKSTVAAISETEMSTHKYSVMVMAKEDLQLMAPIDGIMHIEEDKIGVEEGNHPSADEGVEDLIDGIQGIEICIGDNPAMIMVLEETIQLEDKANCDLNEVIQEEKTEENLLIGLEENVEASETEDNLRENEERPLTESQRNEYSLEQYNLTADEEDFPLSLETNMKTVQPIKDNNLDNSEKTLEIEEFHFEAGAEESGTCSNEEVGEKEDEAISVQYHELESSQCIEPFKDKLEREIEYPQTLPSVKKGVDEIHKESQAQIKEEEDEKQQNLKLSFDDLAEKRVETVPKTVKQDTKTELIDVARKHQQQVDCHENSVSSKGKQQRIATKKVKGSEHMFMGYPKGHIVLLMTIATAFAVLALLYTKYFFTRTAILENFATG